MLRYISAVLGLRDYDHSDEIGAEPSPDIYVTNLVAIFREVRRVLRQDGTLCSMVALLVRYAPDKRDLPDPNVSLRKRNGTANQQSLHFETERISLDFAVMKQDHQLVLM